VTLDSAYALEYNAVNVFTIGVETAKSIFLLLEILTPVGTASFMPCLRRLSFANFFIKQLQQKCAQYGRIFAALNFLTEFKP
jgi:hypothetical protein